MTERPENTGRDILDRLYTRFDPRIVQPDEMSREAHAEIERLRAENAALIHDNARLMEGWTAECNK